ncbi:MAG: DNA adenine methylase [Candidatus Micrarchaeota archaeon]
MVSKKKLNYPSTRYQGSKRRILPWLESVFMDLDFNTVLDGFGGTGSVSYLFKLMGKTVTYNDILKSNHQSGIALIENSNILLTDEDIEFLFNEDEPSYPGVVSNNYKDIYFLDDENEQVDRIRHKIESFSRLYSGTELRIKKALAYHIFFQSCLSKRPFNLFHRKNLILRKRDVKRSFGNKKTWDKPFREHFESFNKEYSKYVFCNGKINKAINKDIFQIRQKFDLVYLDPPYNRKHEPHPQNYADMYHFLEGIMNYDIWEKNIDSSRTHRPFSLLPNTWNNDVIKNFKTIFSNFSDSIIVISYGNKGKPTINTIVNQLKKYKKEVRTISKSYSYKLNRNNGKGYREVLIIGK